MRSTVAREICCSLGQLSRAWIGDCTTGRPIGMGWRRLEMDGAAAVVAAGCQSSWCQPLPGERCARLVGLHCEVCVTLTLNLGVEGRKASGNPRTSTRARNASKDWLSRTLVLADIRPVAHQLKSRLRGYGPCSLFCESMYVYPRASFSVHDRTALLALGFRTRFNPPVDSSKRSD